MTLGHGKRQSHANTFPSYTDNYAALVPGIGAFFGNRSIVIHFPNKTRITCANFVRVADGSVGPGTAPAVLPPYSSGTAAPVPYSNVSIPAGGVPGTPVATPPSNPIQTPTETPATPLPSSGAMREVVFSGAAVLAAFAAALL